MQREVQSSCCGASRSYCVSGIDVQHADHDGYSRRGYVEILHLDFFFGGVQYISVNV